MEGIEQDHAPDILQAHSVKGSSMGRPRKNQSDLRSHVISFRITAKEHDIVLNHADKAGTTANSLIKELALTQLIPDFGKKSYSEANLLLLEQLQALGRKLNSITKTANTFKRIPREVIQLCTMIDAILNKLIPTDPTKTDPALIGMIKKIGNNLRQLINIGRVPTEALALSIRIQNTVEAAILGDQLR